MYKTAEQIKWNNAEFSRRDDRETRRLLPEAEHESTMLGLCSAAVMALLIWCILWAYFAG